MHEDHRKRVRAHFLADGLSNFPPHNVLELLLFYSISRQDTNEIAHRLIDRFGSLKGVLEAPFEELCKVDGIGENSAVLITFVFQLAKRYSSEQSNKLSFDSTLEFRSFVAAQFIGCKNEVAYLICLNNAGQMLKCCPVSLGTKNVVNLDNRTLLETAFLHNATSVVLAHNHPNGLAAPSFNDIQRTESAVKLFHQVNVKVLDHLIVADGECFSMANHPKFSRIFMNNLVPMTGQIAADVQV